MNQLYEQLSHHSEKLFKTITSDNGSEFAGIYELFKHVIKVYFAHPYASHEHGTKENQHKFFRRYIPKSKRLKEISISTISCIEHWMNNYPCEILSYETAKEVFIKELECLVS